MSTSLSPGPETIDADSFRWVVGHLPSGVTVVTTGNGSDRHGMTASSVTSLSADPPMMLACLHRLAPTSLAVSRSGVYVVNVLAQDHSDLARRFSTPCGDKFDGLAVGDGVLGAPLLDGAVAHLECRVVREVIGGSHTIFLGEVVRARAPGGRPLTYFLGGFGRLERARDL